MLSSRRRSTAMAPNGGWNPGLGVDPPPPPARDWSRESRDMCHDPLSSPSLDSRRRPSALCTTACGPHRIGPPCHDRCFQRTDFRAGTEQGMGDIEETLGHDLQIGCHRYRRTIDVNVDHLSTPLIAAGRLSAFRSNRRSPWAFGRYWARHDNQSKTIFGDIPSRSCS
jgi:hypothetical protein